MRSFWEEKVHVVVENINNKNVTCKVKSEKELMEKSVLYIETCFYLAAIPLIASIGISKQNLLQWNLSKADIYGTEVLERCPPWRGLN